MVDDQTHYHVIELVALPPGTISFPATMKDVDAAVEHGEQIGYEVHKHYAEEQQTSVYAAADVFQMLTENVGDETKRFFFGPRQGELN